MSRSSKHYCHRCGKEMPLDAMLKAREAQP